MEVDASVFRSGLSWAACLFPPFAWINPAAHCTMCLHGNLHPLFAFTIVQKRKAGVTSAASACVGSQLDLVAMVLAAINVLVADLDLPGDKYLADRVAQHGPEDRDRCAHGSDVDLKRC